MAVDGQAIATKWRAGKSVGYLLCEAQGIDRRIGRARFGEIGVRSFYHLDKETGRWMFASNALTAYFNSLFEKTQ